MEHEEKSGPSKQKGQEAEALLSQEKARCRRSRDGDPGTAPERGQGLGVTSGPEEAGLGLFDG